MIDGRFLEAMRNKYPVTKKHIDSECPFRFLINGKKIHEDRQIKVIFILICGKFIT